MSASNSTENDFAEYVFNSTAPAWEGNANFYIRLHTADPGEAGSAVTSEVSYTGYDGVEISRTTGFTISGNQASNAALIQFPPCSGGSSTARYFSVCTTQNGAGQIIVSAVLSVELAISAPIQPQFAAGQLTATFD